jgi:succinate dehydrogenase/fumarate reductase cytochrome b subunit
MNLNHFIITAYAILCYLFCVMFIICNGVLFILCDFNKRLLIDHDYQIYIFRNVSTIYIVILDNRSPIVQSKVKCIN